MDLKHVGVVLHDNLKNGHHKPGKLVNDTYSGIVLVDNRCSFDSWCLPTAVGDELVCRHSEGAAQSLPICRSSYGRVLGPNMSADARTVNGLSSV